MSTYEIRDPDEAKQHLLLGLLLARNAQISPQSVTDTLKWAMEIVAEGSPLPPLGFVGDVGGLAMGSLRASAHSNVPVQADLNPAVARKYDDYVLGRMYCDSSFERSADAIQSFQGRDKARGVAYIVNRIRERAQLGGAMLSPAVVKNLSQQKPEKVIEDAEQCRIEGGWSSRLISDWENLISGIRDTGDLLGPEDVFELESGTALSDFGQRVALRQALQMTTRLRCNMLAHKPRSLPKSYDVATNIMQEDHYPIGGFTSISNKGTVESMLRSELAYIDDEMRPDLFDIKFARDELLYYSRDENQFLRRRLAYLFVLNPDLVKARWKDPQLPCQRIVLLIATMFVVVKQLIDWMTEDAIRFEFVFVTSGGRQPLQDELELLETLFRDEISAGIVAIVPTSQGNLSRHCESIAQDSLCHLLSISCQKRPPLAGKMLVSQWVIDSHRPSFVGPGESQRTDTATDEDDIEELENDTGLRGWQNALESLLRHWV